MPFARESGPGYFFAFRRYPLLGYRARLFLDMGFAFLMCRGLGRGEAGFIRFGGTPPAAPPSRLRRNPRSHTKKRLSDEALF